MRPDSALAMTPTVDADRAEATEYGRWLFAQECVFVAGAPIVAAMPTPELPETAFAGRSNVGKSSLLNALTRRKALARTSHTPGRTQQLNFFRLGGRLMLVDLPGYGYARASKSKIMSWNKLVGVYLRGRPTLRRLNLLVDARHGLKEGDLEIMALADQAAVSYQVVLTKADKTKPDELNRVLETLAAELKNHAACLPEILVTSARAGTGIVELRAALAALAAPRQFG